MRDAWPGHEELWIKGVAHCFGDDGWEEKLVPPLAKWFASVK